MNKKRYLTITLLLLVLIALVGCVSQESTLNPVERQQIKNVVKEFVVRDTNIPDQEVTIEAVAGNWARVTISPARVEDGADVLYLQKQLDGSEAPIVQTTVQPGHEARVETTTGWAIILGPQFDFSEAELDQVGVPAWVRP